MIPFLPNPFGMIYFNRPVALGNEAAYIAQAIAAEKLSGDGPFTQRCQAWFAQRYGFQSALLTTSCTAALEMAALLLDLQPGDEVILPTYTFVSSANAFALRGARLVFADSGTAHPNLDADQLEALITPRTRAIVVVHYAGQACEMDDIMALARRHNLRVVEDAAQAIDAYYRDRPLGSFGDLACFSFHETKNIICGEGGMLVVNDPALAARAEIIWQKGTNRKAFARGEVDKYTWVDLGSSFLPSELNAAYLLAQLEMLDVIQDRRRAIWAQYHAGLAGLPAQLPPSLLHARHNAHLFYLVCASVGVRSKLINYLKYNGVESVFHYHALHCSPYFAPQYTGGPLPHADRYADCLVRLPLHYHLSEGDVARVVALVRAFFAAKPATVSQETAGVTSNL